MILRRHTVLAAVTALAVPAALLAGSPQAGAAESAVHRAVHKEPTGIGRGGAVSTVDPEATRAGLRVLRRGGNAVDAAVAAAATLGVTEPYSSGIGGGGFFVMYDAESGKVRTLDGRETAPKATRSDTYEDLTFDEAVTSGLSVGVPGTPRLWDRALRRWGTLSLAKALRPAANVARRGFVVDRTFCDQTAANEARFRDIVPTRNLFLPGGELPEIGSVFRNPDLATTYDKLGKKGVGWLYDGKLGRQIVRTVQAPPKDPAATRNVRPGLMTRADLTDYRAVVAQGDQRRLPRPQGVGHAAAVVRRVHRRRGAEHPAERQPARDVQGRPDQGAAQLPRGERAGLRRPWCVRRCSSGDAARRAEPPAVAGVRRRAVLRAGPDQGGHQAGACGQPGRTVRHRLRRRGRQQPVGQP